MELTICNKHSAISVNNIKAFIFVKKATTESGSFSLLLLIHSLAQKNMTKNIKFKGISIEAVVFMPQDPTQVKIDPLQQL